MCNENEKNDILMYLSKWITVTIYEIGLKCKPKPTTIESVKCLPFDESWKKFEACADQAKHDELENEIHQILDYLETSPVSN